jgi:hypothetical protein
MLTDIELSNFKSFGEKPENIGLSKINIFIGENGTGKSTVIQALALLNQSIFSNELKQGQFRFSSYGALVHNSLAKSRISIGIKGKVLLKSDPDGTDNEIILGNKLIFADPGKLIIQDFSVTIPIGISHRFGLGRNIISGLYSFGDQHISPSRLGNKDNLIDLSTNGEIGQPVKMTGGQSSNLQIEHELLIKEISSILSVFSGTLKKIFIDFALRGFDKESYSLSEAASDFPVTGGEVFSTFAYRRELEEKVSSWLSLVTGTGLSIHLVPKQQIELKNSEGYDIYQGGFGSNQLVRPLLQLAISPEDALVAIEEADISLHPRAQVKLCEVLADIIEKENKQLILTSHSETMLVGFLNLITEGKLAPEELRIYYFEKKKGNTGVVELKTDNRGAIEGGLKGFSEVNLENYKRHMNALSRRAK